MLRILLGAAMLAITASLSATAADDAVGAVDSGDTAWILVSSAFVLLMTFPGLSLFYGGLVRAKNFLAVMLQVGAVAAVVSLVWIAVGHYLAFGPVTNGWISTGGNTHFGHLVDVRESTNLPENVFAIFQLTFAAITPGLMIGAWVDRSRFSWVLTFCGLWSLIVYAPVAHWVWGGGWMATRFNTLDFAGGIVVHTTAGVSALVTAALLGRRQGFPKALPLPHSPAMTMAGAALLWVGWFGFNGGSALAANATAGAAIINTHAAACAAAMAWLLIERLKFGKPTSVGFATGAVAGLATVTPAAGFVSPMAAIVFGVLASLICFPMIGVVKNRLGIDDSLDVFAVHGVGGMTGSLLLAVFMAPALGGAGDPETYSLATQLTGQVAGVAITAAWSAIGTFVLAVLVARAFPMRVSAEDEREGLDLSSHGEHAWDLT